MQKRLWQIRLFTAAWLISAAIGDWSRAAETSRKPQAVPTIVVEPANWQTNRALAQVPPNVEQTPRSPSGSQPGVSPGPNNPPPNNPAPNVPPIQAAPPTTLIVPDTNVIIPRTQVVVPPVPPQDPYLAPQEPNYTPQSPLLDDGGTSEDLPSVVDEQLDTNGVPARMHVEPYGGGHPWDWSWGCGGSPYRTYGMCDNFKVGPAWHITVDGIVFSRDEADLEAIAAEATGGTAFANVDPVFEQFGYGPGGRVTFTSQVGPKYGWDLQAAYEGIEEWNSSVVYAKQPLVPPVLNPPGFPGPVDPEDFGTEQRRVFYRSSYHSGELNFVRAYDPTWRLYCGVRYIKFDDEINDFTDQNAPPPLPGPGADATPVITEDRLNLFDLENNLMGFQLGILHDTWRVNRRLAFEGFINTGVYYNKIKYTNLMATFITQDIADNTTTTAIDESRIDFADTFNNDVRELSEISNVSEVSLSAVCRLNKCWAMRAGYQCLFIHNLHLAEDAFVTGETDGESLFFHGWHAGVECRR